ncbi:DinB family protein [Polaribacter pectinis]|uniref:DinB family protein n=1 Tax=Polaribacter pectinis TaxID=2738844 RepID=A0A7G9LDX9_9FLAO|nr:DinB family protein [Polaribacter pectinis]QNM86828.1 DinB family protein [Polaribacter pectinis]
MIKAIEENLLRGKKLLENISNEEYANTSVAPYHSSIGCHIRHILDVFSCIFKELENNVIDFSVRERNELAEIKTVVGIEYFNSIILKLKALKEEDFNKIIKVSDDLGSGKVTANYTLSAVLMQTQSHTIHHYASIGYLIYQLGIDLPDADFGFNPTTPKKVFN